MTRVTYQLGTEFRAEDGTRAQVVGMCRRVRDRGGVVLSVREV